MTTDMDTELIDSSNILAFYSHSWLHLQLVIAGYSWFQLVTAVTASWLAGGAGAGAGPPSPG